MSPAFFAKPLVADEAVASVEQLASGDTLPRPFVGANPAKRAAASRLAGGEGGIRTPDRLAPMPHFECGAFDHSATSPGAMMGDSLCPRSGRVLGEDGGADKALGPGNRWSAKVGPPDA